jgi:Ser/Thr protein kinase RdoA (MazF antagonist)
MNDNPAVAAAADEFEIGGEFRNAERYGNGHIHDTYLVTVDCGGTAVRFILQRLNTRVFPRTRELMENVERVTAHLSGLVEPGPDRERRALHLIPTREGADWHVDGEGSWWRMYQFVEGARSVEQVQSPAQCFEAGRAFGRFQKELSGMAGPRLHETIPYFHHTPRRFAALEDAIAADVAGRARFAGPEIAFAMARKGMVSRLLEAGLPERVTHNDTKINNVLLDDVTGEGVCVIDLDTVMPGLAPYDFGDMVRTATNPAAEDERDLDRVFSRFDYFEALVRGYLDSAGGFLTREEKELLAFSGRLITFEIAIRFLTDYLCGDTYFKVHREGHNLDRTRTQFRLVESIEAQERLMEQVVRSLT